MSSREKILQAISNNKPPYIESPLLTITKASMKPDETVKQFIKTLEGIGGKVISVPGINAVGENLMLGRRSGKYIVNTVAALGAVNSEINSGMDAASLEMVHEAYIQATIGVAENGAVWLYESQVKNRLLPFICQHLVIILHADTIVATMHEAYEHVDIAKEGYGVFLAGPSKTADIEQSLVIGAHGARSLLVYLVGSESLLKDKS